MNLKNPTARIVPGGEESCRKSDPPQAENLASEIFIKGRRQAK